MEKVFVVIEMFQGILEDVSVYINEEEADERKEKWLKEHELEDDEDAEYQDDYEGTSFKIYITELK